MLAIHQRAGGVERDALVGDAPVTAAYRLGELAYCPCGQLMVFADTVQVAGSAQEVYDFLYDAAQWVQRLPHVSRVQLREDTPNIQILEMDTRTRQSTLHTTRSVRVCFPYRRIVYKQLLLPALAQVHNGQWMIEDSPGGVAVTSEHTVVIKESGIASVLGAGAGVAEAQRFIREALSFNSLTTLNHAKRYAEARADTSVSPAGKGG